MLYSRLSVVNDMLGLLGESPVNDLDSFHPMVPKALNVLDTTSGEIQSDRWWFNTEDRELIPQVDTGFLMLPDNTVSVDSLSSRYQVAQRGRKLYDLKNNTFVFTEPLKVRLCVYYPFDELPNIARAHIAAEALLRFQNTIDGDDTKTRRLIKQATDTKAKFQAEHTRQVQANMLRRPGPLQWAIFSKYNRAHFGTRWRR